MGSNTSKQNNEAAVPKLKNDSDVDANSDPRSPTPEIVRTPLQNKGGSKHNITKNADLRKTFEDPNREEKLIHNNPILSAVIKNQLLTYDPRSPTQDFERTPIVIASKIEDFANDRKLREQNLSYGSPSLCKDDSDENYDSCAEAQDNTEVIVPKNLCNGFLDMTLNETIQEPLGSSTASNEAIESNISKSEVKHTQLLETNFDYDDTCGDQLCDSNIHNEKDFKQSGDNLEHIPLYKILDEDPRSPTVGIERTPIVVAKTDDTSEENVEDMSDDTLIKALQNTNADLRQSVRSYDGHEGLLIYEDESTDLHDTPKKSKSGNNSVSRTPLSCVKNKETGHARSKSANTLQDPKNQKVLPTKIPKRVSHIPRLKSLSKSEKVTPTGGSTVSLKNVITKASAIGGDCENTPPHSHRDRWDKDNSIVL